MSEAHNVKFVENNEKWMWKKYDEQGSVIYRSPLFETEREAREDYQNHGSESLNPAPETGNAAPEGDMTPGDASAEGDAGLVS
jgi:hypothetical protein